MNFRTWLESKGIELHIKHKDMSRIYDRLKNFDWDAEQTKAQDAARSWSINQSAFMPKDIIASRVKFAKADLGTITFTDPYKRKRVTVRVVGSFIPQGNMATMSLDSDLDGEMSIDLKNGMRYADRIFQTIYHELVHAVDPKITRGVGSGKTRKYSSEYDRGGDAYFRDPHEFDAFTSQFVNSMKQVAEFVLESEEEGMGLARLEEAQQQLQQWLRNPDTSEFPDIYSHAVPQQRLNTYLQSNTRRRHGKTMGPGEVIDDDDWRDPYDDGDDDDDWRDPYDDGDDGWEIKYKPGGKLPSSPRKTQRIRLLYRMHNVYQEIENMIRFHKENAAEDPWVANLRNMYKAKRQRDREEGKDLSPNYGKDFSTNYGKDFSTQVRSLQKPTKEG